MKNCKDHEQAKALAPEGATHYWLTDVNGCNTFVFIRNDDGDWKWRGDIGEWESFNPVAYWSREFRGLD